jgi:hypothetical protein
MKRDAEMRVSLLLAALFSLIGAAGAQEAVAPRQASRLTVQASESCEPRRPECSIAAALEVLADGGTLELSAGRHPANLRLHRDVTLEGAGAGKTILDGGGAGRVLTIERGARVVVRGVTITGGKLDKELERDGGGVWNVGVLTLERCEVTGNVAVDDGGGIRNDATLTVLESTVHGNQATRWGGVGGGIYSAAVLGSPELAIIASTIHGNVAGDNGGGIWCEGPVTILNSTISGNSAAHTGGGIRNNGELTVSNSTIAFNRAGTTGGGIHHLGISATLSNTILAANSAAAGGADCHGVFASRGYNLVQQMEGCTLEKAAAGPTAGGREGTPSPAIPSSLPPPRRGAGPRRSAGR